MLNHGTDPFTGVAHGIAANREPSSRSETADAAESAG
jgi:hypothetical protein